MGTTTIYDQLNTSLLDAGVQPSALPGTLHDVLSVITDESGGNPYAINDNTTGKSYQFSTYDQAAQYMTENPNNTMAVGLFQLLLHGGMGDQVKETPLELLNPNSQFQIALPTLISNEANARMYPTGTPEHFNAVLGNPWYSDRGKDPSNAAVDQTAETLKNNTTDSAFHLLGGMNRAIANGKDATSAVSDFLTKLWSINTVLILAGTLAIVLILVNMAKGGGK